MTGVEKNVFERNTSIFQFYPQITSPLCKEFIKFTIPCFFILYMLTLNQFFFRLTKRSIIRRLNNDSIFYFISMPVEFAATICFNVNGIFCRRIYCRPNNLEKKYRYRYILTPAKIYALGRQYVPRVPA